MTIILNVVNQNSIFNVIFDVFYKKCEKKSIVELIKKRKLLNNILYMYFSVEIFTTYTALQCFRFNLSYFYLYLFFFDVFYNLKFFCHRFPLLNHVEKVQFVPLRYFHIYEEKHLFFSKNLQVSFLKMHWLCIV